MNYINHQIARTEYEMRGRSVKTRDEDYFLNGTESDTKQRAPLLRLRLILTALINLITR